MMEFEQVIKTAMESVNLEETLLIVTADHSHSFELVGQPSRFESPLDLDHYYSLRVSYRLQVDELVKQVFLIDSNFFF